MPHTSSAAPGWFVKVILRGLANVATYFDDIIVFDSDDPCAHALNVEEFSKNLQNQVLRVSSS